MANINFVKSTLGADAFVSTFEEHRKAIIDVLHTEPQNFSRTLLVDTRCIHKLTRRTKKGCIGCQSLSNLIDIRDYDYGNIFTVNYGCLENSNLVVDKTTIYNKNKYENGVIRLDPAILDIVIHWLIADKTDNINPIIQSYICGSDIFSLSYASDTDIRSWIAENPAEHLKQIIEDVPLIFKETPTLIHGNLTLDSLSIRDNAIVLKGFRSSTYVLDNGTIIVPSGVALDKSEVVIKEKDDYFMISYQDWLGYQQLKYKGQSASYGQEVDYYMLLVSIGQSYLKIIMENEELTELWTEVWGESTEEVNRRILENHPHVITSIWLNKTISA